MTWWLKFLFVKQKRIKKYKWEVMRNNGDMTDYVTRAFSISVFFGFCHLGFDQHVFSGVRCLNLDPGKFLGALWGKFHEPSSKLNMLEQSVQGMCGQGDPLWAGVCDGMAVPSFVCWGWDGVPFLMVRFSGGGLWLWLIQTQGLSLKMSLIQIPGLSLKMSPSWTFTIRQIFRVSLQAGFSRHLPACTPERATPVQPLGHLGGHGWLCRADLTARGLPRGKRHVC